MNSQSQGELTGLSGWLIVLGITIGLSILLTLYSLLGWFNYSAFLLSQSGTSAGAIVMVRILVDVVSSIVLLRIGFLYLRRKKSFTKWFITFNCLIVLVAAMSCMFSLWVAGYDFSKITDVVVGAVSQAAYAAVWILYLLQSKRVKNTFIN